MLAVINHHFALVKQSLISGKTVVIAQSGTEESPSISANGQWVAYALRRGGQGVLAMVSIEGEAQCVLPSGKGTVYEPVLSPYLSPKRSVL